MACSQVFPSTLQVSRVSPVPPRPSSPVFHFPIPFSSNVVAVVCIIADEVSIFESSLLENDDADFLTKFNSSRGGSHPEH